MQTDERETPASLPARTDPDASPPVLTDAEKSTIFDRAAAQLRRFAAGRGVRDAEIDDFFQEARMEAWPRLDEYRPNKGSLVAFLKPWLLGIARELRRGARSTESASDIETEAGPMAHHGGSANMVNGEEKMLAVEQCEKATRRDAFVRTTLAALPRVARTILVDWAFGKKTQDQTARAVRKPVRDVQRLRDETDSRFRAESRVKGLTISTSVHLSDLVHEQTEEADKKPR